ncbi:hypothetical protein ACIQI8_16255 [Streptomyces sp. NPDC092369]|uniref:hypothetical protein n=1 Tax=Streptomyces sp. NPDC092369 TaxID=3366015 RepID=UPI00381C78A5
MPMPRNMYDGSRAHYGPVSNGVDITDSAELALHDKALATISGAASYGDVAELISKVLLH